jgi:hypothetical protein
MTLRLFLYHTEDTEDTEFFLFFLEHIGIYDT